MCVEAERRKKLAHAQDWVWQLIKTKFILLFLFFPQNSPCLFPLLVILSEVGKGRLVFGSDCSDFSTSKCDPAETDP